MNILKKISALLLVFAMVLSFAACHEKDEIAVTVKYGDKTQEFTSAMYLFALMGADEEASAKAQELFEEQKVDLNSVTLDQLYAQKIDGKDYVTWVHDRAKEMLAEYAAYKFLCEEKGVKLPEDGLKDLADTITSEWNYYGEFYETNGVGYNTFKNTYNLVFHGETYFKSIYGKGGTKAVADAELVKAIGDNYILANIIEVSYANLTDAKKKEAKEKLDGYVARLGKKTSFETIYKEYYEVKEDNKNTSSTTSTTASNTSSTVSNTSSTASNTSSGAATEQKQPKDLYATVFGSEAAGDYYNTNYYSKNYYSILKDMKVGEIKVVEDTTNKTYALVIRGDILGDEFYTENESYLESALNILKKDEFDKSITEFVKTLNVSVDGDAIEAFDVKNLYKYSK